MTPLSDSGRHSPPSITPADVLAKCAAGYHSWAHRDVYPWRPGLRRIVCIVCAVEVDLPCDENGRVLHDA